MKINPTLIEQLNTRDNRFALAQALNTSEVSIRRHLKENKEDGELTKAASLKCIAQITSADDSTILVEDPVKATS